MKMRFHSHANLNSFSYEWLCTRPRFEREALGNSEMVYLKNDLYFTTNFVILLSHFPLFLSVKTITKLNLGQGETFEMKIKYLAVVVHVVVLQSTAKKCPKNYNARAEQLFCSLNLLFSDVPVAVAVVGLKLPFIVH